MSVLCCACTPLHLNQTELKVRELLEDRWRRRNHAWEWDITNACQSSSSALLDACSLTFLIVQDKFQLHTLEAFFFSEFDVVIFHFAFACWMWHIPYSVSLTHMHFQGNVFQRGEKEEWQLRINAFFIIIDSLHFSAGSESNLCLNISSLPLGAFLALGRRPSKKVI